MRSCWCHNDWCPSEKRTQMLRERPHDNQGRSLSDPSIRQRTPRFASHQRKVGVVTFQHLLFRFLISKTVRAENECGFGLKVPRLWWLIKIAVWNEGADKVWAMQKTLGEDLDWGHHIPREPDVLLPSLHQVQMTEGVWCMSQPLLLQQRVYRVGGERKELKGALFLHWPYTGSGQSSPYSIESLPCHYAYQDIINLGKQWYLVAWTVPTKDPWKAQSAIGRWWNL